MHIRLFYSCTDPLVVMVDNAMDILLESEELVMIIALLIQCAYQGAVLEVFQQNSRESISDVVHKYPSKLLDLLRTRGRENLDQ